MDEMERKVAALTKQKGVENGKRFLSVLGRDREFMDAIETPAGKAVLDMLNDRFESKMAEILAMKTKSCADCPLLRAKIELEETYNVIGKVKAKINNYHKKNAEFNKL